MDLDKRTEHCTECGICIMGSDHHCPWTSKCIGKKNLCLFNCFLISLFAHIGYLIFALVSLAVIADPKYMKKQKNKIKNIKYIFKY